MEVVFRSFELNPKVRETWLWMSITFDAHRLAIWARARQQTYP
ncbi:hypothetical protein [Paenibacillus sp. BT-177]|nr:hypothetical protein [Paenibacillus sp. BT-177]